jgi:mono/diheme cytochrome c family protein
VKIVGSSVRILLCSTAIAFTAPGPVKAEASTEQITKGRYLLQLANCAACHTDIEHDGSPLAGGRALESDFGIFYSPNITPDSETGIGQWSDDDFIRALTDGISPGGHDYYPSFPYLAYRHMNRDDMLAIKAYLFTQPAVRQANKPHELKWYLSPFTLSIWKWLNSLFTKPVTDDDSRGSYIVNVLGHCNECHTPRNEIGMLKMQNRLQGNDAMSAPDISSSENGVGDWSRQQLIDLFTYGELPDGDYVADHMGEVVDYSSSKWTAQDMDAVIQYLQRK